MWCCAGPFWSQPLPSFLSFESTEWCAQEGLSGAQDHCGPEFPPGASVNSVIPKDTYMGQPVKLTFPSVDHLVTLVKKHGQGWALFKRDLKRAYRQIPVDPDDVHLLGYAWESKLYFYLVLPMGLRSAALCCQRVTNLISLVSTLQGIDTVNYLYDFGGADVWVTTLSFEGLGTVLRLAGVAEAREKACAPATVMTFLGLQFDTENLTLTITPDRLAEIQALLTYWEGKDKATRLEFQSLLGKLQFVAGCVHPGRIFVARLLNFFCVPQKPLVVLPIPPMPKLT